NIYRISSIREFEGATRLYGLVPTPLGQVMSQSLSEGEKLARFDGSWSNFKVGDDLFPVALAYTDPELFDIFTFEFISGSAASLKDNSTIIISEETALKLFKTTDVIGKQITQVM